MDMATTLAELGVTASSLDSDTRRRLDRDGYAPHRSEQPRRALHSYFTRRGNPQQLDQKRYLRPGTAARLSPAARFILDA